MCSVEKGVNTYLVVIRVMASTSVEVRFNNAGLIVPRIDMISNIRAGELLGEDHC